MSQLEQLNDTLRLNYTVILDDLSAQQGATNKLGSVNKSIGKNTSVLDALNKQISTLTKAIGSIINAANAIIAPLSVAARSTRLLALSMTDAAAKRAEGALGGEADQFIHDGIGNLRAELLSAFTKTMGAFATKGGIGQTGDPRQLIDEFIQQITSKVSGGRGGGRDGGAGDKDFMQQFFGMDMKGTKKAFSGLKGFIGEAKEAGPRNALGMMAGRTAGKFTKAQTSMAKGMYGMVKSQLKLVAVTEPFMAFLQGLLSPFKILSDILGAVGKALGPSLMPIVMAITNDIVDLIPLLRDIMPLIAEVMLFLYQFSGLSILSGMLERWYGDTEEFAFSGALPYLDETMNSVFASANDGIQPLGDFQDGLEDVNMSLENVDTSGFNSEVDDLEDRVSGMEFDYTALNNLERRINGAMQMMNFAGGGIFGQIAGMWTRWRSR